MEFTVSLILGYLIGSVPFAYLLLKKSRGVDITKTGTGNVGAMNAYEVTNSKFMGITVLVLDVLKGILCVSIPLFFFANDFTCTSLGLVGGVFGHCFNPWLGFKGGRGLATAAGGILIIFPLLLLTWLILWAIFYTWSKDIHLGNVAASLVSLFGIFFVSGTAWRYTNPRSESVSEIVLFATALFLLIIIRHVDPLKELLRKPKFLYRRHR